MVNRIVFPTRIVVGLLVACFLVGTLSISAFAHTGPGNTSKHGTIVLRRRMAQKIVRAVNGNTFKHGTIVLRPNPNLPPPDPCLYDGAALTTYNVGPNQVDAQGSTFSVCGSQGTTTSVAQRMATTNACEGTLGGGTDVEFDSFQLAFQHTNTESYIYDVGCVTCEYVNHHLVGETYPNFNVILSVTSTGTFKIGGSTYRATSGDPVTASVQIQNTGLYAPPCPPTD